VAEVAVDPETGETRVEEIWIAHDIGRAINPVVAIGQVEGSVYMGLGEALMEEMTYRGNRNVVHRHPSLLEYKSPTTHEMCKVHTFLVEDPDPNGPFGAKEVGQGPLLRSRPQWSIAIHDAVGVRIDESRDPQKALAAPAEGEGQEPREGPGPVPEFAGPTPSRFVPPGKGATDAPSTTRAGSAPAACAAT
jgi:CO/xanthine dehydrogenase Mo-binding subunit